MLSYVGVNDGRGGAGHRLESETEFGASGFDYLRVLLADVLTWVTYKLYNLKKKSTIQQVIYTF